MKFFTESNNVVTLSTGGNFVFSENGRLLYSENVVEKIPKEYKVTKNILCFYLKTQGYSNTEIYFLRDIVNPYSDKKSIGYLLTDKVVHVFDNNELKYKNKKLGKIFRAIITESQKIIYEHYSVSKKSLSYVVKDFDIRQLYNIVNVPDEKTVSNA